MIAKQYPTSSFAARAGVTVRTLRYYDRMGLLKPSFVTEAGHRRYSDRDLIRLEQILAMKYLGFSLEEIGEMARGGLLQLQDSLSLQRQMMEEKREQVDRVIRAIDGLQVAAAAGWELDWETLTMVIKAMQQMQHDKDWWMQHYSEEARRKLEERAKGYSQEQAWADARRWQEVIDGMKAAAARGDDPASPEVQGLVGRWMGLVNEFTMGDPEIEKGLSSGWAEAQERPYGPEVEAYVNRALEIYEERK